jgi:hypothetical protein
LPGRKYVLHMETFPPIHCWKFPLITLHRVKHFVAVYFPHVCSLKEMKTPCYFGEYI